jgi:transcriptional regulator with XRE-family HTH domain
MDHAEIGRRIAQARRRRGMSQAVLAGLIGRSESWLSQVERGKRGVDSHAVLTRLATALRIEITEIAGRNSDAGGTARGPYDTQQIEEAMISYEALGVTIEKEADWQPPDVAHLREMAKSAHRDYQAARYGRAGQVLPRLIRAAEVASRIAGVSTPAACKMRYLVYDTVAALLNRVGEPNLAWVAADRAMSAAECTGDPLFAAVSAYRLSYVLTSRKYPRRALEVAMAAAGALERRMRSPRSEQLSVYGALHLAAALAAAADHDHAAASSSLKSAREIADRLGTDENLMGTAFGPFNVAIHGMSVSMRFGDGRTACEIGESLDSASLPVGLVGRRAQMHLDLARAYAMRRQDAAAVNTLLAAERLSPELIRYNSSTRDVLMQLMRREHQPSTPELRPLALRAGLA